MSSREVRRGGEARVHAERGAARLQGRRGGQRARNPRHFEREEAGDQQQGGNAGAHGGHRPGEQGSAEATAGISAARKRREHRGEGERDECAGGSDIPAGVPDGGHAGRQSELQVVLEGNQHGRQDARLGGEEAADAADEEEVLRPRRERLQAQFLPQLHPK